MPPAVAHPLPHALPENEGARLALYAIRRLGAHGLHDAQAARAFITAFGVGFRRPLVLMRAFMQALAETATQPVAIAPCCCGRTTPSEMALLIALARAEGTQASARLLLADQLGARGVEIVLACAAAVAAAFADAGRPLGV